MYLNRKIQNLLLSVLFLVSLFHLRTNHQLVVINCWQAEDEPGISETHCYCSVYFLYVIVEKEQIQHLSANFMRKNKHKCSAR